MKKALLFLLFLMCGLRGWAQLYDVQWAVGQYPSIMDFRNDTLKLAPLDSAMLVFNTIANICDRNGNMLFWTNGVYISNRSGDTMRNSDSLSDVADLYDYTQEIQNGMPCREGVVILPKPGDTNLYYLFHYSPVDTFFIPAGSVALNLYYSIVDMRGDSGRGAVIAKNVPIIEDELLSPDRLAACRHANGRDWWIVKNAWNKNIYYTFLLDPNGVHGPFIQQIGPNYGMPYIELPGYSTFSPDGARYASVTAVSDIVVMDFDRCTGLFSNPDSIYNCQSAVVPPDSNITGGVSLCFSPSSRFLYVTAPQLINQYDLSAARIQDSIRIITDTALSSYQSNILQLAPNGKIYVSCWDGGASAINVINNPDSLGAACDYVLLGQPVLSLNPFAIPYFPNFRLGALAGSACDTLTTITSISGLQPNSIRISPNPGSDYTTISLMQYHRDAWLYIYDMLGNEVYRNTSLYQDDTIDTRSFSSGVYLVRVLSPDGDLTGRFVRE